MKYITLILLFIFNLTCTMQMQKNYLHLLPPHLRRELLKFHDQFPKIKDGILQIVYLHNAQSKKSDVLEKNHTLNSFNHQKYVYTQTLEKLSMLADIEIAVKLVNLYNNYFINETKHMKKCIVRLIQKQLTMIPSENEKKRLQIQKAKSL